MLVRFSNLLCHQRRGSAHVLAVQRPGWAFCVALVCLCWCRSPPSSGRGVRSPGKCTRGAQDASTVSLLRRNWTTTSSVPNFL